jgi:hypothetical protein
MKFTARVFAIFLALTAATDAAAEASAVCPDQPVGNGVGQITLSAIDIEAIEQAVADARARGFFGVGTDVRFSVGDGKLEIGFSKLPIISGKSIRPTPFGEDGNINYIISCGRILKSYSEK